MAFTRITFDPEIMGGQACIRRLRIPVAAIVRCVASRMTDREILDAYPDLVEEDIDAGLQYAADHLAVQGIARTRTVALE